MDFSSALSLPPVVVAEGAKPGAARKMSFPWCLNTMEDVICYRKNPAMAETRRGMSLRQSRMGYGKCAHFSVAPAECLVGHEVSVSSHGWLDFFVMGEKK